MHGMLIRKSIDCLPELLRGTCNREIWSGSMIFT
jgi:hypothetical protein